MNDVKHAGRAAYADLVAQRESIEKRIEQVRAELVADAVATCKALIQEWDLTAADLGLVRVHTLPPGPKGAQTFPAKAARNKPEPKYRDPATGSTWSGRGKAPAWVQGERDQYLIRGE